MDETAEKLLKLVSGNPNGILLARIYGELSPIRITEQLELIDKLINEGKIQFVPDGCKNKLQPAGG